jgi:hypothetical protein
MQKVFETEFVNVLYNPANKQFDVLWTSKTDKLTNEGFQEHVRNYAILVEKFEVRAIFVDARQYNHIVTEEISKWHDEEIIPKYICLGLKKIGFLQPEETFAQLGHQFIFDEEQAKNGLQVQFFDNEANAREWLDAPL